MAGCENKNCGKEHDGTYGSGRFCSKFCACSWSTSNKREQRNEKTSKTLKGRAPSNKGATGYRHSPEVLAKMQDYHTRKQLQTILEGRATKSLMRSYLLKVREVRCEKCGIDSWNGKPITMHLHHVDGDSSHNSLENCQLLCPNCHTQTNNWGRPK